MTAKRVLLAAFFSAIILLGAIWLVRDTPAEKAPRAPMVGTQTAATNLLQVPSPAFSKFTPRQSSAMTNPSSPFPSKSAIYQEYENAVSLRAFFAKYAVDSAPPEAKFLAAKVAIEDCRTFSFGSKGYRENMELRVKYGASVRPAQLAAISKVEQKCGGDWTDTPPSKDRAYELMRSASLAGNSAATAYLLADSFHTASGAALSEKVGQFLASNDLSTIEQAMRAILSVGQRVGHIPLSDGESVNAFLFTDAWMLAMCDIGKDCGPDSLYILGQCAAGFCNFLNFEDHARQIRRSPNDFQEIMKLRAAITAGLAGGDKGKLGWNVFSEIKG